jgi:hypothetical protein
MQDLDEIVTHAGGSQRRLIASLRVSKRAPRDPAAVENAGRAAFEAMSILLGCQAEALFSLRVYQPAAKPALQHDLDVTSFLGRIGGARASPALPLTISHAALRPEDHADPVSAARLIVEFCSQPLPEVTIEQHGAASVAIVDVGFKRSDPIDVAAGPFVAGNVVRQDSTGRMININAAMLLRCPTRWLIHDVYLPALWAAASTCSAHASILGGASISTPGMFVDRWFDRLPLALTPTSLGHGLTSCGTPVAPRHAAFSAKAFEVLNVDPQGFVGYRLLVKHPVILAQYVLSFERTLPLAAARAHGEARSEG